MRVSPALLLTVLVLACLTPFLGKAFHIDDPLFVWTARQIAAHPGNPYDFEVHWYTHPQPMWEVTQNPPLASYYIAAVGAVLGWSEIALHAAFLLPAIVVILGTYFLARRLTRWPLLAALVTLVSPAFLVPSTGVMGDTVMLAGWVLAILLWIEGVERKRAALLALSGLLIAICALTKYFGVALVPLLLVYSLVRRKRVGAWIVWLLVPAFVLIGYEFWTKALYDSALFTAAMGYASDWGGASAKTVSARAYAALAALSFAGGCALPALTFAPLVWSRRATVVGIALASAAAIAVGARYGVHDDGGALRAQFALFLAGGMSALGLAFADWRRRRDAGAVLLLLWVAGTFAFASLLNWTVNARSLLPMIPAIGILLARRLETPMSGLFRVAIPLALSAVVALWVTWADVRLAGSQRAAAEFVRDRVSKTAGQVSFEGHWGFQYYMQAAHFRPVDAQDFHFSPGDAVVVPLNNSNTSMQSLPPEWVAWKEDFTLPVNAALTTMSTPLGAGFYTDLWGPLPFAFGRVPGEKYTVFHLK